MTMYLRRSTDAWTKPTLRDCMEAIARALRVELAPGMDASLSLVINELPVSIAPTRHGRLAAFFKVADVETISREAMVAALSEAALWGVRGETMRFVVLDGCLALLWSPEPLPEKMLFEQFDDALVNALAVAEMANAFPG